MLSIVVLELTSDCVQILRSGELLLQCRRRARLGETISRALRLG